MDIGHDELLKSIVQDLAKKYVYPQSNLSLIPRSRGVRGTGDSGYEHSLKGRQRDGNGFLSLANLSLKKHPPLHNMLIFAAIKARQTATTN